MGGSGQTRLGKIHAVGEKPSAVGGDKPLPDFLREYGTISDFLLWWLENPVLSVPYNSVLSTYYGSYQRNFGPYLHHHYANQTREIVEFIRASSTGAPRVLEVGTGCGTEAIWFALQGARVVAIDVNAERLEVAQARQAIVERAIGRSLDLEFRLCSLFDLEEAGLFDFVWMEQSFHHVEPRADVYPVVSRLLVSGGRIVISEANGWNPLVQMSLLHRRGLRMVDERITADGERILYGNERITVPSVLVRGFEGVSIVCESVRYFRVLPNFPFADRLLSLEKAIPGFFTPVFSHFNYVGRKRSHDVSAS